MHDIKKIKSTHYANSLDKQSSSSRAPLAGRADLLDMLPMILNALLDQPLGLEKLPVAAADIVCLFGPIVDAYNMVMTRKKAKAKNMASVFGKGDAAPLGSLLRCVDPSSKDPVDGEDTNTAAGILKLKKAVYLAENNLNAEDISDAKLEAAAARMDDDILKKFVQLGDPTKNMLMHLFHYVMVHFIFADLKLADAIAHLTDKSIAKLILDVTKLAGLVGGVPFHQNMNVLGIIQHYILPGMDMDEAWELAASILIRICDGMTNANAGRRPAEHAKHIQPQFTRAQLLSVSGVADENGVDYCGSDSTTHKARRRKAVRTFLLLLLKKPMMRHLPAGLFDDTGGYMRSILRLTPTEMYEKFTFVKEVFFNCNHGNESVAVKSIRDNVLNKYEVNDGERTLLLDNDEQVNGFRRLIDLTSLVE